MRLGTTLAAIFAAGSLWSNPANWSPSGVPRSGDTLVFETVAFVTLTNDLEPGTRFDDSP
jgi:hypothetical protein